MKATLYLATLFAALIPVASMAAVSPDMVAFERDLASGQLQAANATLDRLIDARLPKDGVPRADPELNDMIGRMLSRRGLADSALGYLQAAHRPDASPEVEARLFLAEGQARLIRGDLDTAITALDQALALAAPDTLRAAAARTRIEALLVADPLRARSELPNAGRWRALDAAHAWKWALLEAQIASVNGDAAGARKAADVAWSDTARVALDAVSAPARVAALRGALDAQVRQRKLALAAFAVAAHGTGNDGAAATLADRLPVCGRIVTPADRIIVSVFRDDENAVVRIAPLTANRPEIVRAFIGGIDGDALADTIAMAGAALAVELRCRTAPSASAPGRHLPIDPASVWAATRGILPRFGYNGEESAMLTAAYGYVEDLTKRFGTDSALLIGPSVRLAELTANRLETAGDVSPARFQALRANIARLLAKTGGAEGFAPPGADPVDAILALDSRDAKAAQAIVSQAYRTYLTTATVDLAYATYRSTDDTQFLTPLERSTVLATLETRARSAFSKDDLRLISITIDRIESARDLRELANIAPLARSVSLPSDLCTVGETVLSMTGNAIGADDFPQDGVAIDTAGLSVLEFGIDAKGSHDVPRTLVASPPLLFDDAIAKRQSTITFSPAYRAGKPMACRGWTTRIRWKLPTEDNSQSPIPAVQWQTGI